MSISELRHFAGASLNRRIPINPLGRDLVKSGEISQSDAALAEMVRQHCDTSLDRILIAEGLVDEDDLLNAHARRLATKRLNNKDLCEADALDCGIAPGRLLRHGLLPLLGANGRPTLAIGSPEGLATLRPCLPASLDHARLVMAPRRAIQDRIAAEHREVLRDTAQSRVPALESCRTWEGGVGRRLGVTLAVLMAIALISVAFPVTVFAILAIWACLTLLLSTALKIASFVAKVTAPKEVAPPPRQQALPKVSILVPLFRETEIAHALIARLSRLTYPKCLLDVLLVLEEDDLLTQQTLAGIDLPSWVRPVVVPDGRPRTKPRAMNYALDFCEGDIIGIFDAEDAPDPDQITKVARRFQQVPREVACLQGILDYYNPKQNWIARCFTIEYATWFRTILPGMTRLGFAIPLGGTTLYFRRDVLEELGGWDAHNVTEDADLGFRLARHGYRTEMIETVTEEEANCLPWAWVKQRSRWLKGYMTTYLVHMRAPRLLFEQLGARKFWGFQAHFIATLSQFFLVPVLWSFWLMIFGMPHPLDALLPDQGPIVLGSLFLVGEVLTVCIHMVSVSGPRHRHLMPWTPSMHFYTPLGAIACYKALYELVCKPFYWDKTNHGLSVVAVGKRRSDGGFDLTGVKLEPGDKGL